FPNGLSIGNVLKQIQAKHQLEHANRSENTLMSAIAIIGMACRYAEARSPRELWENVLAQRRSFRRIPAVRLRLDDYSRDGQMDDHIYLSTAAVLEDYEFDRIRFQVS